VLALDVEGNERIRLDLPASEVRAMAVGLRDVVKCLGMQRSGMLQPSSVGQGHSDALRGHALLIIDQDLSTECVYAIPDETAAQLCNAMLDDIRRRNPAALRPKLVAVRG
jgi:hypothetical protein